MIEIVDESSRITVSIYGPILDSIKTYDALNSIFNVYHIPRSKVNEVKNIMNTNQKHEVLYFLFGDSNDMGIPEVYVGQSDDMLSRLKNHDNSENFDWKLAICAVPSKYLGKEYLRALEKIAIKRAAKNCILVNEYENKSYKPHPNSRQSAKILISDISDYLTIAGYPILTEIEKEISKSLYIKQNGQIFAEGEHMGDTFVVYKGSYAKLDSSYSMSNNYRALKEKLIKNGILVQNGDVYQFTKDYVFSSPSAAACVILGLNLSGWEYWKNKEGKTLKELFNFE